MAIDTAEKRYSMLNLGLPFFRVLPEVDAGIEADDRLHLLGLYSGISAFAVPTKPGVEWTLPVNRLHWTLDGDRLHWMLPTDRLHWTLREED